MSLFPDIVLALGVMLFACAALCDVATRTIPNILCVCVASLGLLSHTIHHSLGPALLGGLVVFIACYLCWYFGMFGGGDAKLLSAAAVLAPTGRIEALILLTSLSGGVLSIAYLIAGRCLPPVASRIPTTQLARALHAEHRRILNKTSLPYGVAIAFGSIAIMIAA